MWNKVRLQLCVLFVPFTRCMMEWSALWNKIERTVSCLCILLKKYVHTLPIKIFYVPSAAVIIGSQFYHNSHCRRCCRALEKTVIGIQRNDWHRFRKSVLAQRKEAFLMLPHLRRYIKVDARLHNVRPKSFENYAHDFLGFKIVG